MENFALWGPKCSFQPGTLSLCCGARDLMRLPFMSQKKKGLRRRWIACSRRLRELRMIAHGLVNTSHVVMAHIIPMRRCNLACAYCNEYDAVSKPVPLETMYQRLDHLAKLGTAIVTISGGEPILHPNSMRSSATFATRECSPP